MTLSESNHRLAALRGAVTVPAKLAPFINVDPGKYSDLEKNARPIELDQIRRRYGKSKFHDIRVAVCKSWQCAMTYFPAYRFQMVEYLNDEWLAAVDFHKGFHRDHVNHQVLTYYVARTLLEGKDLSGLDPRFTFKPNGKTLRDQMLDAILLGNKAVYLRETCREMGLPSRFWQDPKAPIARVLWGALIDEAVCLACYFHDIGYPWQFVDRVDSALRKHHPYSELSSFDRQTLSSFRRRLMGRPFDGYKRVDASVPLDREMSIQKAFNGAARSSHGLPGAVAFLHLNDVLRRFPDNGDSPARRFCLEWAAMAIMMHDLQKTYAKDGQRQLRVDFAQDPMSFLLTLADQVQDFERPNADFYALRGPSQDVRIEYKSKCSSVELEWDQLSKTLTISYCFPDVHDYVRNRDKHKKDAWRDYFDPAHGYLNYGSRALGINLIDLRVKNT